MFKRELLFTRQILNPIKEGDGYKQGTRTVLN